MSPVRYGAVQALSRIDPKHEAILPAWIGLLNDPRPSPLDPDEKAEIIMMIGRMRSNALPAIPTLIRILKDKNEESVGPRGTAECAAWALGRIGPAARDAIPTLVAAIKAEDYVPRAATRALVSLGSAARSAIPDLIALLKSKEIRWRWSAAQVLGAIGPEARDAVPALVEALNDPNYFFAADVGQALLRIDSSQRGAVETRLAAIPVGENSNYARAILVGALGRRSAETDNLTRRMLKSLDEVLAGWERAVAMSNGILDDDLEGTGDQFDRLAKLGPGAALSIPRLTELTHHPSPIIQHLATEALRQIDRK